MVTLLNQRHVTSFHYRTTTLTKVNPTLLCVVRTVLNVKIYLRNVHQKWLHPDGEDGITTLLYEQFSRKNLHSYRAGLDNMPTMIFFDRC